MNHTNTAQSALTVPDAAARAGVAELTLREALHRGEIPFRERIVVQGADVDTWAANRATGPAQ